MQTEPALRYCHNQNKIVPVRANVIACLMDQPERWKTLFLACGNLTFHGRFGYSMNTGEIKQALVPYKACYASMWNECRDKDSNTHWREGTCPNCICWAYNIDDPLLRTQLPANYPFDQFCDYDLKIASFRLKFYLLRRAVSITHQQIISGKWTSNNALSYLKTHCIQPTAITQIIECATNCYSFIEISKESNYENSGQNQSLLKDKIRNPRKHAKVVIAGDLG
jgi:hypothetical protein